MYVLTAKRSCLRFRPLSDHAKIAADLGQTQLCGSEEIASECPRDDSAKMLQSSLHCCCLLPFAGARVCSPTYALGCRSSHLQKVGWPFLLQRTLIHSCNVLIVTKCIKYTDNDIVIELGCSN